MTADWTRQGSLAMLVALLYWALLDLGVSTAKPQGRSGALKAFDLCLQPSRTPFTNEGSCPSRWSGSTEVL